MKNNENTDTETVCNTRSPKTKFKIHKKHVQGFIAGIVVGAILVTSIMSMIYPGILTGNISDSSELQYTTVETSVSPNEVHAEQNINASFALNIPEDKINDINKDNIELSGFFEGMSVTDTKTENNQLIVNIQGTPEIAEVCDSDTDYSDGYICACCDDTVYSACVSVGYPYFTSDTNVLEYQDTYDTDISLTLIDDSFVQVPSESDISLDGIFKDMQVSNVAQNGNTLSFHINGARCEDQINGQISVSGNMLNSGISVEKTISVTDALELFSITPITVEKPFEDTLILHVSNDFFTEDISADMFTLGEDLQNAKISNVEYMDSTSVSVTLCADELSDAGYGTIALSEGALQSGRTVTAEISIQSPVISMQNGDDEIMAAAPGEQKEYMLTIYSEGDDFLPTISVDDFTLEGTMSSMTISNVTRINGYKIELTIVGSPEAGEGAISIDSSEFGDIQGVTCPIVVTDSAELYGEVNLADYLPDMTISFYDKDGNALDMPSATTDENGSFLMTVTPDMPADSIATVKAKNNEMELIAPFDWENRESIHINAFTTLMADSIANSDTKEDGITAVYSYLGFEDCEYSEINYSFIGDNDIFSHQLFEEQANGDVNGYIHQLEEEIRAGKTHSFVETTELSGETGGIISAEIIDWAIDKIKEGAIEALKAAAKEGAKEGSLVILRKTGILKPSTATMLEGLQKSVDDLSDQVRMMKEQIIHEVQLVELESKMSNLNKELDNIDLLYAKYVDLKSQIVAEVDQYNENHPNSTEPINFSEMPITTKFFGPNGVVAKEELDKSINNIIKILNGSGYSKSLIMIYYNSLTQELPFAHNAAAELYNFMQYVTSIETIGLELYSAQCWYCNDTVLTSSLKTIQYRYESSISEQLHGRLPDKSVFNLGIKGDSYTTVKLNKTGKYYLFSNVSYKMKDGYIYRYHGSSMGRSYTSYSVGFEADMDKQDITNLFYCRNLYYTNLTYKQYLTKFLGVSFPDWVIFNTKKTSDVTKYVSKQGYDITFYDIGDNKYRTYSAYDLYNKYSDWTATTFSTMYNIRK